ncbi:MAG: hypothetical protein H6679_03930 [Epsilonproteobacteria bacterium]|nr:hypothetical protein [Campylobacterota bacterium]
MNKTIQKIIDFTLDHAIQVKTGIIALVMLYLLAIFQIPLLRFTTTDTPPELNAINTEVIKKLGPFAVKVDTGMLIKNFPIFDVKNNRFEVDAVVWFEFNADEIMLSTIESFSFDNSKIKRRSPPDIKMIKNRIFVKYDVLFELDTNLQFHKFPFEDHRLSIVLTNNFVTPEEMYYMVDVSGFQLAKGVVPSSWQLTDVNVDSGFLPIQLDEQDKTKKINNPKALFIINFAKAGIKRIMVIFIPIFSATFLSLLSFLVSATNYISRFSLAITAVTALLGYRFVIEQMMPKVGYMTTTDTIYLFLLVFSFVSFAIQLLVNRYFITQTKGQKDVNPKNLTRTLEVVSMLIFIFMVLLLASAITYIILT